MKNLIYFFILSCYFISCDDKKTYEGKWTLDISKITNNQEIPINFQIRNDSIIFNYLYFDHDHKYALDIKKDRFFFNDWTINSTLTQDTLSLNNLNFYIKDTNDSILTYWRNAPITKIDLPQKNRKYFNNYSLEDTYI